MRGGAAQTSPNLPPGEIEDLSGRADLDGALAHAGQGHERTVPAAVEYDVLPYLIAERDRVEADAELR
jgi:hypothetical protein